MYNTVPLPPHPEAVPAPPTHGLQGAPPQGASGWLLHHWSLSHPAQYRIHSVFNVIIGT